MSLLAGRPFGAGEDVGPDRLLLLQRRTAPDHRRDQAKGADSVEAIGRCLKAGTNCGGCKPGARQGARRTASQAVASLSTSAPLALR